MSEKPLCIVRAPVATRSGYGRMSRDIVRHLIEYDKYDVKVHSVPWGDTPMTALDPNNPQDKMILDRILTENINKQPDLFVTVTIPGEFQRIGKFNIGFTAGIETSVASVQWVQACNQVDVLFVISKFSKQVFEFSKYGHYDPAGNLVGNIKVDRPIEVLNCCVDTNIFKKLDYETDLEKTVKNELEQIPESFNFLFVGHWLRGNVGEDRKNVGLLVKVFLETFKQVKENQPGLILKTSGAGFSILDREEITHKINKIKETVELAEGQTLPNIYLLHGELTDKEMNSLYNHPKVKANISLTKGEGFGYPLLEASLSGKPVIASGWSGHLDFLDGENALLVGGELKPVHESALWENVIIKESTWFYPDVNQAANAMYMVFKDYSQFKKKAAILSKKNRSEFNYGAIKKKTFELLDKYVPEFSKEVEVKLPKLTLPKLKKVEHESGAEVSDNIS